MNLVHLLERVTLKEILAPVGGLTIQLETSSGHVLLGQLLALVLVLHMTTHPGKIKVEKFLAFTLLFANIQHT